MARKMSGFDPYFAASFQGHDQQNSMDPYPPSTTSASNVDTPGLKGATSVPPSQANMQQPQNQMPPSAFGGMDQNIQARRASMMFDTLAPSSAGDFSFSPSPVQGVNNPNMMFAPGDNLQLQHMQSSQGLYENAGQFTNMEASYDPTSFDTVNPLASFNYGTQNNYPNPAMGLPMGFENTAAPDMTAATQPQSVDMMFPVSSYAALSQPGMQGPNNNNTNPETLDQSEWLAMSSSFGLPISGQNFQNIPFSGHRSLQSSTIVSKQNSNRRASRPSTYLSPNPPATTMATPVSGENPYIPSGKVTPNTFRTKSR